MTKILKSKSLEINKVEVVNIRRFNIGIKELKDL